jgi:putative transposase
MSTPRSVLRVGDRVGFDGDEHLVTGLAGTQVRLRADSGAEQVILAGHLMAAPDFELLDAASWPEIEPFGLLESLPAEVVAEAEQWRDHLVEVETGLPPNPDPGVRPRPGYDPQTTTLAQRQRTKADELGVGLRTVERKRGNYTSQGLWGLVDQRAARTFDAAGRADARLVEVLREVIAAETDASTGTRSRLMRRAVKRLEELHGAGVVPVPGKTAFYALIDRLSVGRHTFGSAATRRQLANRPGGVFTATLAARPGEQVQIDSTPIDVRVLAADGVPVRADLTIAVDVATRTICAAVLRPESTKDIDAALLLAKMLVPEPMRPGWSDALRMSASRLPHQRLLDVDARMREAAARPVIVPEQVVIDHGNVFISETFTRACGRLGISIQPARKGTPTDKSVVEATFDAIKTLFAQHVAGFKGANVQERGRDVQPVWTLDELQDLFDEWLIVGWQHRQHDALRDPHAPRQMLTPNERYTSLVAVAGYLPVVLNGTDYLELLPVKWRVINAYGIKIEHRTYDCPELGDYRREHSGLAGKRGLWEVHYAPLRPLPGPRPHPERLDHCPLDAPGDGHRAVRGLHLAARPPPGRRGRSRRHRKRDRPRARRAAHPRRTRPGQGQRPHRRPHPHRCGHPPARVARAGQGRRRARIPSRPTARTERAGDPVRCVRRRRRSRKVAMTGLLTGLDGVEQLPPDESLTTKEGWRRFVTHQPAPPVFPDAAELAALTPRALATLVQARRDYHSDLPLAHTPVMRKLLATGRLLVQLNRGQISARRGMILSGASGTGKTTALSQLGRTHERAVRKRHPGRAGEDRIPVVYVTVPTDATPKMLAVEFARFYGVEFSARATMPDIVNTVCAVAARTHLELVLIDEIHNILDTRARAEVSDQLKYFAERYLQLIRACSERA